MKLKQLITLTTIFGILVMMGASVWIWLAFKEEVSHRPFATEARASKSLEIPAPEVIKQMAELEHFMEGLQLARPRKSPEVDLSAFGDVKVGSRREFAEAPPPSVKGFPHRVSFAFSAGNPGFCVIDGVFYKKGAKTDSGVKILDVRADSVLLEKDGTSKWIPVILPGVQMASSMGAESKEGR